MGDLCLDVGTANDFLSKDTNRISGRIARSLAINSPFMSVLDKGTFMSGISDIQRSVVQEAVAPVLSQAAPVWQTFQCNPASQQITTGATEYQYQLEVYPERGPDICLTQSYSAFKNTIVTTEQAISDHIQTLWNSWIRFKLYSLSASKAVALAGASSDAQIISEGYATTFVPGSVPNSPLTFAFTKYLANYLAHRRLAGPEFMWGNGNDAHYRLISDADTIDAMRNEMTPTPLGYLAAGAYRDAIEDLTAFGWENTLRGVNFAVDQSILRASDVNADGTVVLVEPFISQVTTKGVKRRVNPGWVTAPYQISFLLAKHSFVREVPEEFLGEGLTKFDRQYWAGDLRWHNVMGPNCNIWGDTGFHKYKLASAMRPVRPEFCLPILHGRCKPSYGLNPCTLQTYYSASM